MKCPGQDSRYWKPGAVFEEQCPGCGAMLEFFKDDTSRLCRSCGHHMVNPRMDFGCAAYCRHAAQCIGSLPPEAAAAREELLKQRVALEMKKFLGKDFRRIGLSSRAAAHAERLAREEKGDPAVITSAAYLAHTDTVRSAGAEDRGPRGSETTDPAAEILTRAGFPEEMIGEVREILRRLRNPGENESVNFKAVFDAFVLSELEPEVRAGNAAGEKARALAASLLTDTGRRIAEEIRS